MKYKRVLIVLLIVLNNSFLYSKQDSVSLDMNSSYDSLRDLEDKLFSNNDFDSIRNVLNVHLKKAKSENNLEELSWAYYYFMFFEEDEKAIIYADSAITISEKEINYLLPGTAYYMKGLIYYENGKIDSSLSNLIKSYDLSKITKNYEQTVDCLNGIASIKVSYGEEKQALKLHKEALIYLANNNKSIRSADYTRLVTMENLAKGYLEIGYLDSARTTTKDAIILAEKINEKELLNSLSIFRAQINYYDNKFLVARDTLQKYVETMPEMSKADIYYYLGNIEEKLQNQTGKLAYFKKIDSIIGSELKSLDNVKDIYQTLLSDAINQNDKERELEYLKKLIHYDSIQFNRYKNVRNIGKSQFDLPKLQNLKSELEVEINREKLLKKWLIFLLAGFLVLISLLIYRNRIIGIRLKSVLSKRIVPKISNNIIRNDLDLDEQIYYNITIGLEQWEEKKGFLDKEMTLRKLSKILDTNSTYLSRIVNVTKEQNFSSYLKDLRITYAINFLKENPEFIGTKSNIVLAEYFGFNSLDVFTRALKEKIGLTPYMFLKGIKSRNL